MIKLKIFLTVIIIIAFFCKSTSAYSQELPAEWKNKKNTIELYLPVCHFFDQTQTNWTILVPHARGSMKDKKVLPATAGIQFTRSLSDSSLLRLSALQYGMRYNRKERDDREAGEVMKRQYFLFSAGYLHKIFSTGPLDISAIGEINYRHGYERIYIYSYFFEIRVASIMLRDIGLSGGFSAQYALPLNLLISAEAKYTRFIYRHDKGVEFFGDEKRATPNTLTFKLGLGYRF